MNIRSSSSLFWLRKRFFFSFVCYVSLRLYSFDELLATDVFQFFFGWPCFLNALVIRQTSVFPNMAESTSLRISQNIRLANMQRRFRSGTAICSSIWNDCLPIHLLWGNKGGIPGFRRRFYADWCTSDGIHSSSLSPFIRQTHLHLSRCFFPKPLSLQIAWIDLGEILLIYRF